MFFFFFYKWFKVFNITLAYFYLIFLLFMVMKKGAGFILIKQELHLILPV